MSEANKAVFLSYAHEDAAAARRIAEALRGFGVEVWFDQSELRGGDQWDANIRGQIKACGIFIPLISRTTQTRDEAYFRLEWKLADDRSLLMAPGKAFIVPVVVDDTAEYGAVVPESFNKAQWMRLPNGEPSAAFLDRIRTLTLAQPAVAQSAGALPAAASGVGGTPVARQGKRIPGSVWPVLGTVVVAAAVGIVMFLNRKPVTPPNPSGTAGESAANTNPSAEAKPAVPAANEKSIAVLPFENMSEDKDNAYFCDGVQEDILTNLANIKALHVVSRTSVEQYRDTTKTVRQIAGELGVTWILEGSVQRAGNKVRVTGQLIDARTDGHVWAQSYDRDLTDIFAIQSELAQKIATSLKAALSPEEKQQIERRPTQSLDAYEAYTKARQILETGTQVGFDQLVPLLKKAVELDPKFAEAWAELGSVYARRYFDGWERTDECLANAKAAIDHAINLAPANPTVISRLGDYYYYGHRDYDRAAEQYQRLVDGYPNFAPAFGSLAFIHRRQGRWADAVKELQRAVELEPRNLRYLAALDETFVALRRFDEAEALQRKIVSQFPGDFRQQFVQVVIPFLARGSLAEGKAWLDELKANPKTEKVQTRARLQFAFVTDDGETLARLLPQAIEHADPTKVDWNDEVNAAWELWLTGSVERARSFAEKGLATGREAIKRSPSAVSWVYLSRAYAVLGDKEGALHAAQMAREMVPETKDSWDGPNFSENEAAIQAVLGEKDRALTAIARLLRTPNGSNVEILRRSPTWRGLRDDPRFKALLADPKNSAPLP